MTRRLGGLLAALLLAACTAVAPPDGDEPRVVATLTILADFAAAVAGAHAEVVSIVHVGGDPHIYEPTPSDARRLRDADLVLRNGLGLEPWAEPLISAAGPDVRVVTVTGGLTPLLATEGPLAGDPDPHLWMDPELAARYVTAIRDELVALDPEHAADYTANAAAYVASLADLTASIRAAVSTIPPANRKLVTTHDAFRYFGERFGLDVIGTIWSISTEREPSADEIRRLVDAIRAHRVPVVFTETTINPRLMERVARDAGVAVGRPLYGDSVGEPGSGAETYIGMMRANTRAIVDGLGGTMP